MYVIELQMSEPDIDSINEEEVLPVQSRLRFLRYSVQKILAVTICFSETSVVGLRKRSMS